MTLKYGLNSKISNAEYHGDRRFLSSSGLKLLLEDEYAFRDKYIYGNYTSEENSAFSFGTYVHTMLLEPHLLPYETAIYRDSAQRRGNLWNRFKEANAGKTIITATEAESAEKMWSNYLRLPKSQQLIGGGRSEETYAGEILGVPVKVRFDSIGDGYGLDVKTTSMPCDLRSLQQTIDKYDYALSAALYMEVAKMCGANAKIFYFLFANKKTHDITLVETSPGFLEQGREQVYKALEKYQSLKLRGFFDDTPLLKIIETTEAT